MGIARELTSKKGSQVIELHFANREGRVCVVPPDNDLMAMPVDMAIAACQAFNTQIRFKSQFDQLLEKLGEWLEQRRDALDDAFLTLRDSGLLFLVVTKSHQHDEDLISDLTDLDLEIAQEPDYDLISLSVHAVPRGPVDSFISQKMALRFVPDGDRE